ncbi:hypothetical protein PFMALIP_02581 [Plasmodium falciparum MaliPS096_E11]|uniref:Uncharacterized protein n=1 Tax=Plasmodium falciparum MaliPS096_E11 TaxID=1036727 RepID=A0A024WR48_PLAFA|nr:hypothetical protein PFMALIP_02581 [Plasmodium falciparum MaliPS096_E11]
MKVINFLFFFNIVKNINRYFLFPFYDKYDLYELLKDEVFPEYKIKYQDGDITFSCLVHTDYKLVNQYEDVKLFYKKDVDNDICHMPYNVENDQVYSYGEYHKTNETDCLINLTKDDVKNLFIDNNNKLNTFLYNYKKINIQNIPLKFIVDIIYFINKYGQMIIPFKNNINIKENDDINEYILRILSFCYLKIYVLLNSYNNISKEKKYILSHLYKIINNSYYLNNDILNYIPTSLSTLHKDMHMICSKKHFNLLSYFILNLTKNLLPKTKNLYSSYHQNVINSYVQNININTNINTNTNTNINTINKNYYKLTYSIYKTLLSIYYNFFDYIKESFDILIFLKNSKNIFFSLCIYLYNIAKIMMLKHPYDMTLQYYLSSLYNINIKINNNGNINNNDNNNDLYIPLEIYKLILNLLKKCISFFYLHKDNIIQHIVSNDDVIDFLNTLSYFNISLYYYKYLLNIIQTNDTMPQEKKTSDRNHINNTYNTVMSTYEEETTCTYYQQYHDNIFSYFFKHLIQIKTNCINDLNESNKLILFKTLTKLFVFNKYKNVLHMDHITILLNQIMHFVIIHHMHISKHNYFFIISSYINLKKNYDIVKQDKTFNHTAYQKLAHICEQIII